MLDPRLVEVGRLFDPTQAKGLHEAKGLREDGDILPRIIRHRGHMMQPLDLVQHDWAFVFGQGQAPAVICCGKDGAFDCNAE